MHIVIVGAGIGGLSASIILRRAGHDVTLLEAAPRAGGLAASVYYDGVRFDGGPYILLDKPGLYWTFEKNGSTSRRASESHSITASLAG